jgi:5-methylcytosine-specific restriction endonuclease McrA
VTYNARKKNVRSMKTSGALKRLFGSRKHRPCAYCGKTLSLGSASCDHVVALSQGGYDKTSNGAVSCRSCNSRKGSMSADAFRKLLAGQA